MDYESGLWLPSFEKVLWCWSFQGNESWQAWSKCNAQKLGVDVGLMSSWRDEEENAWQHWGPWRDHN